MDKGKNKKNTDLDNDIRLLRFQNGDNMNIDTKQVDYKDKFEKLLNHFKDQLEIKDGQVIDPYAGIKPKIICFL